MNYSQHVNIELEFLRAADDGDMETLGRHYAALAQHKAQIVLEAGALRAAEKGQLECLNFLLKHLDLHDRCLDAAARANQQMCVAALLPHSSEQGIVRAANVAIVIGRLECLKMVCEHVDLTQHGGLLRFAAFHNNEKAVAFLLAHGDPKEGNSYALRCAVRNKNQHLFDLLYPLSNPIEALRALREDEIEHPWVEMLAERIDQDRLRGTLLNATQSPQRTNAVARKI